MAIARLRSVDVARLSREHSRGRAICNLTLEPEKSRRLAHSSATSPLVEVGSLPRCGILQDSIANAKPQLHLTASAAEQLGSRDSSPAILNHNGPRSRRSLASPGSAASVLLLGLEDQQVRNGGAALGVLEVHKLRGQRDSRESLRCDLSRRAVYRLRIAPSNQNSPLIVPQQPVGPAPAAERAVKPRTARIDHGS